MAIDKDVLEPIFLDDDMPDLSEDDETEGEEKVIDKKVDEDYSEDVFEDEETDDDLLVADTEDEDF
jgi:hypothetical protein